MATRTSMTELFARTRRMIGDEGTAQFSDEDLQDVLDQHRATFRYFELCAMEDKLQGGSVEFKEFWAVDPSENLYQHFEGTAGTALFFTDSTYGTVTPDVFNLLEGKFRFGTAPNRPVRLSGFNYDLYGASAQLLDEWAAAVKRCIDTSDGNQKIYLSQQFAMITAKAEQYRKKMKPVQITMIRSDMR